MLPVIVADVMNLALKGNQGCQAHILAAYVYQLKAISSW